MLWFPLREPPALRAVVQAARHPGLEPLMQFILSCETLAVLGPATCGALLPGFGARTSFTFGAFNGCGIADVVAIAAVFVAAVPGANVRWYDGHFV
jgi:hypothetical protein